MGRLKNPENLDLPPRMIARKRENHIWYYYQSSVSNGIRHEYPLGNNRDLAIQKAKQIIAKENNKKPLSARPVYRDWIKNDLMKYFKQSSKQRGIEFTLTEEYVNQLIDSCNGKCLLTGIPFNLLIDPKYRIRLWAPSIDRIDSKIGYVPGNVRIVATAVNIALNDFGDEVLEKIAEGFVTTKYGARSAVAERMRAMPNRVNTKTL